MPAATSKRRLAVLTRATPALTLAGVSGPGGGGGGGGGGGDGGEGGGGGLTEESVLGSGGMFESSLARGDLDQAEAMLLEIRAKVTVTRNP